METTTIILIIGAGISLIMIGLYIYALSIANKNIFANSGAPISMAQALLSSIHVTIQHLLGVLFIMLVCILMAEEIVTAEAGLPLLSAVAGYLLAKTFKDVSFSPHKKGEKASSNKDNQ